MTDKRSVTRTHTSAASKLRHVALLAGLYAFAVVTQAQAVELGSLAFDTSAGGAPDCDRLEGVSRVDVFSRLPPSAADLMPTEMNAVGLVRDNSAETDELSAPPVAIAINQSPWNRSAPYGRVQLAEDFPALVRPAQGVGPQTQTTPPPGGTSPVANDAPAAASEPPTECDRIAALPPPILSSSAVHEVSETDWHKGVEACTAEMKAHPEEIRFVFQLGFAQDHMKDYLAAFRSYKTAAAAGYIDATIELGRLYYYGHGVLQSYSTAFEYISKAADAGSSRALAYEASMYGDGLGVAKDDAKSLDLAEKAIEAGAPFGLIIVATHYFNGAGVERNYAMAAQYYQQAADLGSGLAMKFLANMYESGYLGPPNSTKANELRLRAQQVDPGSRDPIPLHLSMLRQTATASAHNRPVVHTTRRYVVYHSSYNPAWQAAPGDTRCCPNNMLVCPLGRHFCGH